MSTFSVGRAGSAAPGPRYRAIAAALIAPMSASLKTGLSAREPDLRRLKPRLLADIGENTLSAKRDALEAPLGEIAGRIEIRGLPLFTYRRSPLG